MATRQDAVTEAGHRAREMLAALIRELRNARLQAALSQSVVARALDVSRPLLGAWEAGRRSPSPTELVEWGAVVGLDVSVRAYPGGSPLRDTGQLRLLDRFRSAVGDAWIFRTEVPVSADPRDRRAIDGVLARDGRRVGAEAVTRLVDGQSQTRSILLKQQAAGIDCMILVLADTRHNRSALAIGQPTLGPAFPLSGRRAMDALRSGDVPASNAIVLI